MPDACHSQDSASIGIHSYGIDTLRVGRIATSQLCIKGIFENVLYSLLEAQVHRQLEIVSLTAVRDIFHTLHITIFVQMNLLLSSLALQD